MEDLCNNPDYSQIVEQEALALIPERPLDAHKGTFGHALLYAGSRGKMGAAILSARACMRSGVGLLTVHIPFCGETAMQVAVPEAMCLLDSNQVFITEFDAPSFSPNAIGLGPGLGMYLNQNSNKDAAAKLRNLLVNAIVPLVLDADALNLLAARPELMDALPPDSILTPHPKEMQRLIDAQYPELHLSEKPLCIRELLQAARRFSQEKKVVVVLKGHNTATCSPDGTTVFNTTGNPGMATAGSGDVLTGIVLGLRAQGLSAKNAAVLGVWLHGRAGDRAAAKRDLYSIVAGDIIDNI